jgi:hypothetical protein
MYLTGFFLISACTLVCPVVVRHVSAERVARVEMETKTVRQVGQDLLCLQERLEAEKSTR